MNANFFSQIAALNITGTLQLSICKGTNNNFIVSILLQNEQCTDEAKKIIPPLNVKGTATELDEGFFEKITQPIETVSGLMVNMETFTKQMEEAEKQSAIQKAKTDKDKKVNEEREKKYKQALLKSDELEKEGKYREAYTKLPTPSDYPGHIDEINNRKASLSAKFAPDLFNTSTGIPNAIEPQTENVYTDEAPDNDEDIEDEWEGDNETE